MSRGKRIALLAAAALVVAVTGNGQGNGRENAPGQNREEDAGSGG